MTPNHRNAAVVMRMRVLFRSQTNICLVQQLSRPSVLYNGLHEVGTLVSCCTRYSQCELSAVPINTLYQSLITHSCLATTQSNLESRSALLQIVHATSSITVLLRTSTTSYDS